MTEEFLRLFESLPGAGWLKQDEAWLLYEAAQETEGSILEVGCYHGRSTCLLASLGRPLYCVDPFRDFDDGDLSGDTICRNFVDNVNQRGHRNVFLSRCRIEEWNAIPVGFAYLDGDHTKQGTLNQISKALECGARVLCLHDYDRRGGGRHIADAVDEARLRVVSRRSSMVKCLPPEEGS